MKPLLVTFKAKPEKIWYGETPRLRVKIPALERRHCDLHAMRTSRRFGSYANSDLFPSMLNRSVRQAVSDKTHLWGNEPLPVGVSIDKTGFLWVVTVSLEDKQ